jgi:hypothetical protein
MVSTGRHSCHIRKTREGFAHSLLQLIRRVSTTSYILPSIISQRQREREQEPTDEVPHIPPVSLVHRCGSGKINSPGGGPAVGGVRHQSAHPTPAPGGRYTQQQGMHNNMRQSILSSLVDDYCLPPTDCVSTTRDTIKSTNHFSLEGLKPLLLGLPSLPFFFFAGLLPRAFHPRLPRFRKLFLCVRADQTLTPRVHTQGSDYM